MQATDIFRNLAILSKADGEIAEAEVEGLKQLAGLLGLPKVKAFKILADVTHNQDNAFIIPQTEDAKHDMMHKLVWLSMVDGRLDKQEYAALIDFVERCELPKSLLDDFVGRFQGEVDDDGVAAAEANAADYRAVQAVFDEAGVGAGDLANAVKATLEEKDFDFAFSSDEAVNRAFYDFLWIAAHRYMGLNARGMVLLPMRLDMMAAGDAELEEVFADFILTERTEQDGVTVALRDKTLEDVKSALSRNALFMGWG